ncbi:hypothetical protein T08_8174 [Trichinella sp. T8]|nr:hypothetical protein T08_8174 [Trichinella sp. T8]
MMKGFGFMDQVMAILIVLLLKGIVLLLKGMRIIDIFERKAEEPFNYIEKASITLETVKTPPQVT